jgi:hypothetical protein
MKTSAKVSRRLCSEIQLFDLCSLNECGKKEGKFCTDEDLLLRFNEVSNEDDEVTSCGIVRFADKRPRGDYPEDDEWVTPELYRGINYVPEGDPD